MSESEDKGTKEVSRRSFLKGVAVPDVMRYGMYYKYYGNREEAVRLYSELPADARASLCAGCEGYCTALYPHGLRVRDNLVEADRLLA